MLEEIAGRCAAAAFVTGTLLAVDRAADGATAGDFDCNPPLVGEAARAGNAALFVGNAAGEPAGLGGAGLAVPAVVVDALRGGTPGASDTLPRAFVGLILLTVPLARRGEEGTAAEMPLARRGEQGTAADTPLVRLVTPPSPPLDKLGLRVRDFVSLFEDSGAVGPLLGRRTGLPPALGRLMVVEGLSGFGDTASGLLPSGSVGVGLTKLDFRDGLPGGLFT